MMHYSVQPSDRMFVKSCEFLPFAKSMAKNIAKNISKNLSDKYSQNTSWSCNSLQQCT